MGLRIIAVTAVLSVLVSTGAMAAERDACPEVMGCCMQDRADMAQPCSTNAQRFERTCCCSIAPDAPATAAPVPPPVERPHEASPPVAGLLAVHPATADPAPRDTRLPPPADRGPPPASRSLFAQHIALLL